MNTLPPELLAFALQVETMLETTSHVLFSGARTFLLAGAVLAVLILVTIILLCRLKEEPATKARPRLAKRVAFRAHEMVARADVARPASEADVLLLASDAREATLRLAQCQTR